MLDRLAALEAGRLAAGAAALFILLSAGAWAFAAASGHYRLGALVAAVSALVIASMGLLYAFRLGTPSASV